MNRGPDSSQGPAYRAVRACETQASGAHLWHRSADGQVHGLHRPAGGPEHPAGAETPAGNGVRPAHKIRSVALTSFTLDPEHSGNLQVSWPGRRWAAVLHLDTSSRKVTLDAEMLTLILALLQDEPGVGIDHRRWLYKQRAAPENLTAARAALDWVMWRGGPERMQRSVLSLRRTERGVFLRRWTNAGKNAGVLLGASVGMELLKSLTDISLSQKLATEINELTGETAL